jgi:hypothetical protein
MSSAQRIMILCYFGHRPTLFDVMTEQVNISRFQVNNRSGESFNWLVSNLLTS